MSVRPLLTRVTECCLMLCDQHFPHLKQLSPWAADSGLHIYSDGDGGRPANASWTSIASVEPTQGTYEKPCLCPPYQTQFADCWLPSKEANIVGFIQSVGRLAKTAAGYSSSLFIIQDSALKPGKREPFVSVTNEKLPQPLFIFSLAERYFFLWMQWCWGTFRCVVSLLSCLACIRSFSYLCCFLKLLSYW